MRFAKAEALGNDFVIVDAGQLAGKDASRLARQVCRRSLDLGADGLILFRRTEGSAQPRFSMQVFNADGSEAEISGNGLRCLAALLVQQGQATGGTLVIQTGAGARRLRLTDSKPPRYGFDLLMGEPVLDSSAIDFRTRSSQRLPGGVSAGPGGPHPPGHGHIHGQSALLIDRGRPGEYRLGRTGAAD